MKKNDSFKEKHEKTTQEIIDLLERKYHRIFKFYDICPEKVQIYLDEIEELISYLSESAVPVKIVNVTSYKKLTKEADFIQMEYDHIFCKMCSIAKFGKYDNLRIVYTLSIPDMLKM